MSLRPVLPVAHCAKRAIPAQHAEDGDAGPAKRDGVPGRAGDREPGNRLQERCQWPLA